MATVSTIDGIKYGFRLLGYGIAVFVIAAIVIGIGLLIGDSSAIVGGIISLIGALILYAGILGTLYKVIADGVSAGVSDAGVAMGGGTAAQNQQYQGGQQQQQQYQGGQQGGDQY
jgi:hypothetical protein